MDFISGNIFIRKLKRNAGDVVPGHTHNFDHTTIVFMGSVRVKANLPDGREIEQEFHAPSHFLVRKDVKHEITFLEDGEAWCVYAHHTPQGKVSQVATGWMDAYL